MATTTTNLGLYKPEYSDAVDVAVFYNENMDKLDTEIQALKNKGAANAGKFLIVGDDGGIALLEVANASGGDF